MKKEEKANVILFIGPLVCGMYRRKIYEEKAKVVGGGGVGGVQHSTHSNSSDDLCLLVCIDPDFLVGGLAAYTLQGKVLWGRL